MCERELKEKLVEGGKLLLLHPSSSPCPSSPAEILSLLDRVGKLLWQVGQLPSKSMLDAVSPTIKAVIKEELLRNQNEDVRVAVAFCISEITRITAPNPPYNDSQMKEAFQLIVSLFENLSDISSHSYSKRTSILETIAKIRSCLIMLDLELDGLIIEMFQHFLKAISDHHPENVFSSMEIIMILVLEESEDIGLDLISPLLACLKKDNQVQPIAWKLAKNVIEKCAAKVKPCLLEAKNSMSFSFDDYSTILSTICMETNDIGKENHKSPGEQVADEGMVNGATSGAATQGDENKLSAPSSVEAHQGQVTKESMPETLEGEDHHAPVDFGSGDDQSTPIESDPKPIKTGPEEDNRIPVETCPGEEHSVAVKSGVSETFPAPATSSKSATSNGVAETENEDISAAPHNPEKPEDTNEKDRSHDDATVGGKDEPADSKSARIAKVESKSAQISKKRSRQSKHIMKSKVPSESSYIEMATDIKDNRITDRGINMDKEVHVSPAKDPPTEVAVHKDNKRKTEQLSSPKKHDSEQEIFLSSSPSGSALGEGPSKKNRRSKKKNRSIKRASPSEDVATKKATGGTNDLEVKLPGQSGKKNSISDSPAEKVQVPSKSSKVERASVNDSEAKVAKKSGRKADTRDHTGNETSSKKKVDDKKRLSEKEAVSPPKPLKVVKGDTPLEETPKTCSKRKRTPSKEMATDVNYGEELVGAKIKIWWPMDKIFYEGVVDSFDPKTKKHKVTYTDGELEHLNLGEEKWEIPEDSDFLEDGEQETRAGTAEISPEMKKKKKAKSGSEPSATKGKTENLRDGDAASSRSKCAATSRKLVDKSKNDEKLMEVTPKSSAKSENVGGKSKVRSKKPGGKPSVDASEKAENSEDENGGSLNPLVKFKLGSSKTVGNDKSKTATKDSPIADVKDSIRSCSKSNASKSGSKSSTNGAGKGKSGSAKSKETKEKEKSPEVVKASESGKMKSAETPKGKDTEEKSGKKRRRN